MNRNKSTTIFRIEKSNNYTQIHRFIAEDDRLSWEARGLLIFLLVKPDDWIVIFTHLINSSPAGKDKVRRIIQELIKYNYIVKNQVRSEHGRFSSPEYIVYELPYDGYFDSLINEAIKIKAEKTVSVKPTRDLPARVNPPLLNIQTIPSKQITNKTTTTTEKFIWSHKLSSKHQASITSLISQIDHEPAQLLLDELSGQIDNINNPVGYFRTLLKSYLAGDFIPAKAIQMQTEREARHKNELAVARSNQLAEERIQRQIEEQRRANHEN
ncbi:MAG: hypothetical protein COA63_001340 [Methylophaga sp.]|nr:hypothetical protein [Methylophaga sp.]